MKKIFVLILCLALMSLACLQTAMVGGPVQAGIATPAGENVKEILEPTETITPSLSLKGEEAQKCAKVIAIESLNMRVGASENELIVTWLKNGEQVQVIDQLDPKWWRIDAQGVVGFARSVYLQEVECVK